MSVELPFAPVDSIIRRNAGDLRVSADAAEELARRIQHHGAVLAEDAAEVATADGRKTLMASDFGVETNIDKDELELPVAPVDRIARLHIGDSFRVSMDARVALADILETTPTTSPQRQRNSRATPTDEPSRPKTSTRTSTSSSEMKFGYSPRCLEHDTGPRHPETADRLRAIREGLKRKHGVEYVDADVAAVDELTGVHDPEYVESVREFCAEGGGDWDPDTVAVEESWDAMTQSAGLAQWAARRALAGDQGRNTPFSLGRPPGHHALSDDAMGFCFVNNVAVAAQTIIDEESVDDVAIVDWDVHHGNGTQDIFYDRGDVFFASIHEEGLYPGTGDVDETGEGDGEGTTLNVPMPAGGDTADYVAVFERTIEPTIERFDPGLLIVSAGFDAHRHDPISRMRVSTEGYAVLTAQLRALCERVDAPIAFVLEGGYGLDVLADGVGMVHETFDGRTPIQPDEEVSDDVAERIEAVRTAHGLGEK